MRLVQILLMGAAGAIVFGVGTLTLELAVLMARMSAMQNDGSGLGAVSATSWAPVAALAGSLVGAVWQYRRSS